MTAALQIRAGSAEDAAVCAAIKNAWIDETSWMPRVHAAEDVVRHYRDVVFKTRRVLVAGTPPEGYIALDDAGFVTSLFVASKGKGIGKALLDHAKAQASMLKLWTFVANVGARRFYEREGFTEIDRSSGDNEEGLADVLLKWEAAR